MEKQEKKILHIINSLGVGGAENILVGIINGLPNFSNHLIILDGPETLLNRVNVDINFKNLRVKNLLQLFFKIKEIRRYIKENKIDIVHSHLYLSNVVSRLATPSTVPTYNHLQNLSSQDSYERNKLTLWLEKISYKKSHHIIAVSNEVLKDFDKWVGIKGKTTVLYNFIDDRFWGNATNVKEPSPILKLVAVGNLRYQKNYWYAIEAFKKMPSGVSLDVYGEGELRIDLQSEIDRYNLPIRLLGSCNNLQKILVKYDAFLMTSFFEGLPVALLEAMACGLPALLSDIPVLKEVGGDTALYFNTHDTDSLIQAVNLICSREVDLHELSRRSLERVEKIGKRDIYLENLRGVYNENF